ncbi:MAG: 2-keto-4-pentenoate hydratase/2-oxohepta-3-ene,7-dioic acid hydratase-like protein [Ramlibacter sp.]|nr:2-keto-4-pentenoate hydratase/2-oxohepta-3-ene,7-dioic acid hydratase-like protein [Ramlibacter sp.]
MKLVRYGNPGKEKPGLIDADGKLRDLSSVVPDIGPAQLGQVGLTKIRKANPAKLPLVRGNPRFGCPVAHVPKFIAIGLNYSDHAAESNMPIPAEPIVFMKATSCIQGPNDPVMLPRGSVKTDWEVELGYQLERGSQWDKGKGCDTFGPIGPWLVTSDEMTNVQKLAMWLDVNGERMQTGNTRTMIFNCAKIVSYCSHFMTLEPGDVITTGTPPGVGLGMKPPRYLKKGDVMTLGIEGLGEQRQLVVPFKAG